MVQKSKARVSGLGSAAQSTDVPLETEKWHVQQKLHSRPEGSGKLMDSCFEIPAPV